MMVRWADKVECMVNNAVNVMQALEPTKVLIGNQADISIMHSMLLRIMQKMEKRIRVKAVGELQLIVDEMGILDCFFSIYASEKMKANFLSFADVEDLYDITHVQKQAFIVHMGDKDLVFSRREKLYVADWDSMGMVAVIVKRMNSCIPRKKYIGLS
jgi:hypothetical protein